MGIRKGNKGTGKSPAFKDPTFIKNCQDVFYKQLNIQKPKAIFVLGKYSAEFLSQTSKDLLCWKSIKNFTTIDQNKHQIKTEITFNNSVKSNLVLLTHPSFRPANLGRRTYNNLKGADAEREMVKSILT